jgi:hypothetical protein
MHRSIGRVAALLGAGALALAVVTPAFAAEPLTYQTAVDDTGTPAAGKAWVRVLHASPDAPAVDVFANDVEVLSAVPFKAISNYLPVDAGTINIKVCVANPDTTSPAGETCVINADVPFEDGKKYTVAATDVVANITPVVIPDTAGPNAEQAQVRVVHLSADTPAVDVLTQDKQTKVVENLAYKASTDYLPLAAGSYDLIVCATGSTTVCPLDLPALPLEAGTAYSVFAIGSFAAIPTTPPASPNVTPPASSTVAPSTDGGASTGNLVSILAILGIAGLATVGLTRRFATRRVEK